jgi:hypothetical protein
MGWIDARENPPILNKMLVFCQTCKNIHTVHYDYGGYCLAETCYDDGHLFTGKEIDFDYYMPLPKPPKSEESQVDS